MSRLTQSSELPDPAKIWQLRAKLKTAVREFFGRDSFTEVETPVLVPCPGTEAHLDYFATQWMDHQGKAQNLWLRSSPELHMKQVLAQGMERIFQFAVSFRNHGELSPWHHPEFLMLEWYHGGISFSDFIAQSRDLIFFCISRLREEFPDLIQGSMPATLQQMTVGEAFLEFAGIHLEDQDEELAARAKSAGMLSLSGHEDFETAFFKILLERIEPAISRLGLFVLTHYPPSQAALSQVKNGLAHRFEFYWNGVELCNGFEELLNPEENRQRIGEALKIRHAEGRAIFSEDEDFYAALSSGIPQCCGNALGLDRLLARILGFDSIAPVLPLRQTWPWKNYAEGSCLLSV
ncbi:MAG: EF-P lysine aminoacylase GenX [Deltaproteobacteria bacterium]|nr:EF-P lysine aminoacylase GenX [Deltaproteobacteria bacterium]